MKKQCSKCNEFGKLGDRIRKYTYTGFAGQPHTEVFLCYPCYLKEKERMDIQILDSLGVDAFK